MILILTPVYVQVAPLIFHVIKYARMYLGDELPLPFLAYNTWGEEGRCNIGGKRAGVI